MYIHCIFELSMVLDSEKFHKVLAKIYDGSEHLEQNEEECVDRSLAQSGITVTYRDSQYKKKIRVIIDLSMDLKEKCDVIRTVCKRDKQMEEYFGYRYRMNDFVLSGMVLATDIDVGTHENVLAYLKVLQRIGKVKGFSPSIYDCFETGESFCLDGNSNGIQFRIYDLGSLFEHRLIRTDRNNRRRKAILKEARGILRAEVQLTKSKVIRAYTDADDIAGQIEDLTKNCQGIFMDTFSHIIPFGDFYKKDRAMEIVRKEVGDTALRRKMLQLLSLIPEKKSLHLAQKAMNCRDIERVMDMFAKINLSPVTISKRHGIKHLRCLYITLQDNFRS